VCRISVLGPVPKKTTEPSPRPVPPEIVPAFVTLPEPMTPKLPPLIVALAAFVTSSVAAAIPFTPPAITPPAEFVTLAEPSVVTAVPIAACIVPALMTFALLIPPYGQTICNDRAASKIVDRGLRCGGAGCVDGLAGSAILSDGTRIGYGDNVAGN